MTDRTATDIIAPVTARYVWRFQMGELHGGLKARLDSEAILDQTGAWQMFDTGMTGSPLTKLRILIGSIVWLLRLKPGAVFFVQYPLHGGRAQKLIAAVMFRRFRTVVLLHDLDELRETPQAFANSLLAKATHVISTGLLHERLREQLKDTPVSILDIWDYLVSPTFKPGNWNADGPILFAGSLWPEKVSWLYRSDTIRPPLVLRGRRYEADRDPGFGDRYAGPFDAETPSFEPPPAWGLVWDGAKIDSANTDDDYERLNQPHKLSLYLACGIPVIVWSEGQAARWVTANGCGVTTPSLAAISGILSGITPVEHQEMRRKAEACGEKIRAGHHLLAALDRLGL